MASEMHWKKIGPGYYWSKAGFRLASSKGRWWLTRTHPVIPDYYVDCYPTAKKAKAAAQQLLKEEAWTGAILI
jgi:hypothetical protein